MGGAAMAVGGLVSSAFGSAFGGSSSTSSTSVSPIFPSVLTSLIDQLTFGGSGLAGMKGLTSMAQTGEPTDVGPAYEALKNAMSKQVGEGRSGILEAYGSMGLRHGSNVQNALVDYETQTNKDFLSILSDYTRQAQESAANRKLAASESLSDLFANIGTAMTTNTSTTNQTSMAGSFMNSMGAGLGTMAVYRKLGLI